MANINQYDQQITPSGAIGGRDATAADMGFGQGVTALGQGLGEYAQIKFKQEEEDAQFKAAQAYQDGVTTWKTYLDREKNNLPQDPQQALDYVKGMTDRFNESYGQWAQDQVAAMPTKRSQQTLMTHLAGLKGSMIDNVMRTQAMETGRLTKSILGDKLSANETMVLSDPTSRDMAIQAENVMIDASALQPWQKQEWKQERKTALWDASLQGSVLAFQTAGMSAPTSAIREFRDHLLNAKDDYQGNVSPRAFVGAVHSLNSMLATRETADEKLLLDGLKERMAERQAGIPNGLNPGEADFIKDPVAKSRAVKEIQTANVAGQALEDVKAAGFDDLQNMVAADRAALNVPGSFTQDHTVAAARLSAIQTRMKQEADDFAGYAMQTSPAVATAFDRMQKGNFKPEDVQNYATMVTAEQQRLNPYRPTTLLPSSQADALAGEIQKRIANGNAPGEVISAEAAKWGKYWPQVFGQVGAKLPPDSFNIGAGMRPADANFLATLSTLKPEEIKRGVDQSQLVGVEATVAKKYGAFTASMSGLPGGDDIVGKVMASNEKLVYGFMRQGMSVNDAVDRAYDALVGHKYQFNGNLRVPAGQDAGAMGSGASQILKRIDQVPIIVPPAPGVAPDAAKAQWVSDIKSNGVWFTNADETGAALYVRDRTGVYTSVRTTNGQPVEYTWGKLKNMSQLWWWNDAKTEDMTPDARPDVPAMQPKTKGADKSAKREGKQ